MKCLVLRKVPRVLQSVLPLQTLLQWFYSIVFWCNDVFFLWVGCAEPWLFQWPPPLDPDCSSCVGLGLLGDFGGTSALSLVGWSEFFHLRVILVNFVTSAFLSCMLGLQFRFAVLSSCLVRSKTDFLTSKYAFFPISTCLDYYTLMILNLLLNQRQFDLHKEQMQMPWTRIHCPWRMW